MRDAVLPGAPEGARRRGLNPPIVNIAKPVEGEPGLT